MTDLQSTHPKIRRAIVCMPTERSVVRERNKLIQVQSALPHNYIARLDTASYIDGRTGGQPVIIIEGVDDAGWTLDGYVIPRLATALIIATEV
jgi:hypothetical protein